MSNQDQSGLLPGEDLVQQGLADLQQGLLTECAFLVLIASPRLKRLGIPVPSRSLSQTPEHELFDRLNQRLGPAAHSYYNSLLRRVASYARCREREQSAKEFLNGGV